MKRSFHTSKYAKDSVNGFSRYIEELLNIDRTVPWMSPAYDESKQARVDIDMDWATISKHLSSVFNEWNQALVLHEGKLHTASDFNIESEGMALLEWKYTDTSRMKSGQNHMSKQAVVNFTNKWLKHYLIMGGTTE